MHGRASCLPSIDRFSVVFSRLPGHLRYDGRACPYTDELGCEADSAHEVVRQGKQQRDPFDTLQPTNLESIQATVARQSIHALGSRCALPVEKLGGIASHSLPPLGHRRAVLRLRLVNILFGVLGLGHRRIDGRRFGHGVNLPVPRIAAIDQPVLRTLTTAFADLLNHR